MASISKEIVIGSSADNVWEVIGDFETGPSRMAPGFVVRTSIDGGIRIVTFADGTVARERFVSVDHGSRRIVYSVVGDATGPAHDNASMQVFADGNESCRLVWIHDVLPDELAPSIEAAMSQGLAVIEKTLASRR
jgi:carbon monoxide dehydrogenase subunit G